MSAASAGPDSGTIAGVVVGCVVVVALMLALFLCRRGDGQLTPREMLKAMYASKGGLGAHPAAHAHAHGAAFDDAMPAARPSAQFDHHQVYGSHAVQMQPAHTPFTPYVTHGSASGGSVSGRSTGGSAGFTGYAGQAPPYAHRPSAAYAQR